MKNPILLLTLAASLLMPLTAIHAVEVENLRCEYLENPLGIDVAKPRLSWEIAECRMPNADFGSEKSSIINRKSEIPRGLRQTAYQVLVASSEELLKGGWFSDAKPDLWDSGKVESDRSLQVAYEGRPLESRMSCHWKVRVWDQAGQASAWSAPAQFLTGKMKPEDPSSPGCDAAGWQGQWIGASADTKHAAVYLQKKIAVEKPVVRALVYFCGLGFSELTIDGKRVGDYVIGPGFTTYNKRAQYLAFDVTDRFNSPGAHQLDVTLADGWYGLSKDPWVHKFEKNVYVDMPKLLFNLHLQHDDGTETVVVSDASWQWSLGEITRSWIAQEDIDLRQQARDWKPVAVVKGPEGRLVCQKEPPNRIVNEAKPVSFHYDAVKKSATWDFGREINGWVRFQASGPAGTRLTITTTAVGSNGDGVPGFPPRSSTFILGSAPGPQTYEPRFFHGGMRHVTVTGLAEEPKPGDLTGCEISSLYTPSGDFKCSDERITWLHDCVRRTMVAYTTFLPNDPVREWKAWAQDIQSTFWSSVYLFDSRAMYERWECDFLDTQDAAGNFPNVTPGPEFDAYNSPWWGGCAVWLPWEWYQYYGDDTLLREAYPAMKRYVDYLDTVAKDGLQQWGLRDWLAIEETPAALVNTPAHVQFADIVSRTATMLGKTDEAQQYAAIAARLRQTINEKFLDPATGIYGQPGWKVVRGNWVLPKPLKNLHSHWWTGDRPCTQAGQVLALAMDIPTKEVRGQVEQALLKEIEAHRGRLSTGFVSTPYLLRVLRDLAPETGWTMTTTSEFPSWLSMTRGSGSDVMKETWGGGQALMPSLGGNIAAWNMESLAGIRPDPAGPGFKKSIIKPNMVGDLQWVNAHHDSPYGKIVSNWKRDPSTSLRAGGKLTMDVTIPPNTTATIFVPAKDSASVTESGPSTGLRAGKPATKAVGVKFLRMENGAAVYAVGSGHYQFQSALVKTAK
jgi:alpha-L-rhamnosidase